jgi:hypothetical protein
MPEPLLNRVDRTDVPPDIRAAYEGPMTSLGDTTFCEVCSNHPTLYAGSREHYSDDEIREPGLVPGVLFGMARFLRAHDSVEKEENCPFPESNG